MVQKQRPPCWLCCQASWGAIEEIRAAGEAAGGTKVNITTTVTTAKNHSLVARKNV